jgi:hypothetical protein
MLRTHIYLTEQERQRLQAIAVHTGRTQSALIREAIDRFIEGYADGNRLQLLRKGYGLWKDRTDLPDFTALRREFDRLGFRDS